MAHKKSKKKKLLRLIKEIAIGAASGTIAGLLIEAIKKLLGWS